MFSSQHSARFGQHLCNALSSFLVFRFVSLLVSFAPETSSTWCGGNVSRAAEFCIYFQFYRDIKWMKTRFSYFPCPAFCSRLFFCEILDDRESYFYCGKFEFSSLNCEWFWFFFFGEHTELDRANKCVWFFTNFPQFSSDWLMWESFWWFHLATQLNFLSVWTSRQCSVFHDFFFHIIFISMKNHSSALHRVVTINFLRVSLAKKQKILRWLLIYVIQKISRN